jgi:hypothetical protein
MSAVWTEEMAEKFMETEPDSMFPCTIATRCRKCSKEALVHRDDAVRQCARLGLRAIPWERHILTFTGSLDVQQDFIAPRDEFGRCKQSCPNCNCRMLFNQLECVKADLESTKKALKKTKKALAKEKASTNHKLVHFKAMLKSTMNAMEKERLLNEHKLRQMTQAMSQMRADLDCRAESPPQTSYEVKDGKQRQWLL